MDVAPEESLYEVTVKRSRSSGTLLKDLLQQGGKILYMAANKVDQFAPATISSSDALERMETLEKLLKEHREEVNAKLDAIPELGLEIQQITPMLKLITEKMVVIDGKVQKTATSSEVAEGNLAQGIRLHDIESEGIHLPEVQKLSFDLNLLHRRLCTIERRLPPPQTVHAAETHAQDDRRDDFGRVRDDNIGDSKQVPDDRRSNVEQPRNDRRDDTVRARDDRRTDSVRARDDRRDDAVRAREDRRTEAVRARDVRRDDPVRARDERRDDPVRARENRRDDKGRARDEHHGEARRRDDCSNDRRRTRDDDKHESKQGKEPENDRSSFERRRDSSWQ